MSSRYAVRRNKVFAVREGFRGFPAYFVIAIRDEFLNLSPRYGWLSYHEFQRSSTPTDVQNCIKSKDIHKVNEALLTTEKEEKPPKRVAGRGAIRNRRSKSCRNSNSLHRKRSRRRRRIGSRRKGSSRMRKGRRRSLSSRWEIGRVRKGGRRDYVNEGKRNLTIIFHSVFY
ncbi:hypothetical protein E3N88_00308 [Mikania micrantha]|uniref:Uncharacterized protein n=1 Tax=Mikania micrantha TaxID=192012 RepID=A0A5N6PY30_9ASTR|nr:hypothetical protein E3N88_00308 [Mikania micrantha]